MSFEELNAEALATKTDWEVLQIAHDICKAIDAGTLKTVYSQETRKVLGAIRDAFVVGEYSQELISKTLRVARVLKAIAGPLVGLGGTHAVLEDLARRMQILVPQEPEPITDKERMDFIEKHIPFLTLSPGDYWSCANNLIKGAPTLREWLDCRINEERSKR